MLINNKIECLYQTLLQRNSYNDKVIKKYIRKIQSNRQQITKLVLPFLLTPPPLINNKSNKCKNTNIRKSYQSQTANCQCKSQDKTQTQTTFKKIQKDILAAVTDDKIIAPKSKCSLNIEKIQKNESQMRKIVKEAKFDSQILLVNKSNFKNIQFVRNLLLRLLNLKLIGIRNSLEDQFQRNLLSVQQPTLKISILLSFMKLTLINNKNYQPNIQTQVWIGFFQIKTKFL